MQQKAPQNLQSQCYFPWFTNDWVQDGTEGLVQQQFRRLNTQESGRWGPVDPFRPDRLLLFELIVVYERSWFQVIIIRKSVTLNLKLPAT